MDEDRSLCLAAFEAFSTAAATAFATFQRSI